MGFIKRLFQYRKRQLEIHEPKYCERDLDNSFVAGVLLSGFFFVAIPGIFTVLSVDFPENNNCVEEVE